MSKKSDKTGNGQEVVLLYCQNSLCDEAKACDWSQKATDITIRAIMMPCSSKVEVPYIMKILDAGANAVEIVACPEKSCKFLIGSLRAEKRIEYIRGLLTQIGLSPEKVGISRKLVQTPEKLIEIAKARAAAASK